MIYHIRKFLRKRPNSSYQDKLIKKLNNEHKLLLEVAINVELAAKNGNIDMLRKLLDKFEKELELHLLYEDTNLYEYLVWKYNFFEDVKIEIVKKQKEMENIAKVAKDFIDFYKTHDDLDKFLEDFENIKEVLIKRIEFEETTLYDIYNNSYKWEDVLKRLRAS